MAKKFTSYIPEVWGGIDCSVNRVGDQFMDQLSFTGHYDRGVEDITRFAALGIKAIRYPIIWERHQLNPKHEIDWRWTDGQLTAFRSVNIQPIAGLMHHGNGPAFTNLLDTRFPDFFAAYAQAVAKRFPWLELYTPINEPLTTARFSGLYGIWYPHKRKDKAFATIFLNQMKATVLAMRAIREINPEAKLLQTEDLGKTYSTDLLMYQAEFENERRWLTYDLLVGNFNPDHALWDFFKFQKIPDSLLYFFMENPCPPDILGADHYLTSERFLDQKLSQYPAYSHGGNHRHRYADVEAIRVKHTTPSGLEVLLKELWDRYEIPVVISEVHLNGTTADQIRWFKHVWNAVTRLKAEGVQIPAITAWALLGSFGWNTLLTIPNGHYEHGAFMLRDGEVIATELASFIKDISENPDASHPALDDKGWWEFESRCLYNVDQRCKKSVAPDRVTIPVMTK